MCTSPLDGWRSRQRNTSGKRSIVFKSTDGYHDQPVTIPCGRCMECRLRRKRAWALRCHHEASLHLENEWLTLTYDDQHLPPNGSLRKADLSAFLKRLRAHESYTARTKNTPPRRFKYFACGEYGGRLNRPHYHALLFGFSFLDKRKEAKRGPFQTFSSQLLDSKWENGFTEIGEVTFDGMAYLAKYICKRHQDEEKALTDAGLETEFIAMSRGGRTGRGIAYNWWQLYRDELLQHDTCIINGTQVSVPQYYDQLSATYKPTRLAALKTKRQTHCDPDELRTLRLLSRQTIVHSRQQLFTGGQ